MSEYNVSASLTDDIAFENFFHSWAKGTKEYEWGPDYWDMWGVDVEYSKVVYKSDAHRLMFLLKWL